MNYRTITGDKIIEQEQTSLGRQAWPEFMQHDPVAGKHWAKLYGAFLDFQLALYSGDTIAGVGNSLPLCLEGDIANLPARGLDWAMEKAADDLEKGLAPNLLVGLQILVNPALQNKGLSSLLTGEMKKLAKSRGIWQVAFPVRPIQKHLYPLVPMEEYIEWTGKDGEPFDPWIRVHTRAGGKIVSVCHESMKITGSVNDWQEWTGLYFRASGTYIVEKALCPVSIDLDKNTGEYTEPNVWMVHRV